MKMKKDVIWYALGFTAYSFVYPLLSIITTRLLDSDDAGRFAIAFATAQTLMFVGKYEVRNFQLSDLREEYSFNDYLVNRIITCFVMMVIGYIFCIAKNYSLSGIILFMLICCYKMVDSFSDVFEGRLQQKKLLYIAGQIMLFKSVFSIIAFTLILIATKSLIYASVGLVVTASIVVIINAMIPVFEKLGSNRKVDFHNVVKIIVVCAPLCLGGFLFSYVGNTPKYAIEGILTYSDVTYFNVLCFPAQVIYLFTDYIFKPSLVQFSEEWNNENNVWIKAYIVRIIMIISVLSVAALIIYGFIGIPILELVFGIKLEQYKMLGMLLLGSGFFIGIQGFLFSIYAVIRKQIVLCVVLLPLSLLASFLLPYATEQFGIIGTALGYITVLALIVIAYLAAFFYFLKKRISYSDSYDVE